MKTKKDLLQKAKRLSACEDALEFIKSSKKRTAKAIWESCERLDWLYWFSFKVASTEGKKKLCFSSLQIARSVLKHVPKGEKRPLMAIETAEAYLEGKAIRETARNDAAYAATAAAYAAAAATAAANAAAAYAAAAATNAAAAVSYAVSYAATAAANAVSYAATAAADAAYAATAAVDAAYAAANAANAADAADAANAAVSYAAKAADAANAESPQKQKNLQIFFENVSWADL